MEDPISWVQIVNTAGVIGLLILQVWAFWSGTVVPKTIVDRILKEAEQRTTKMSGEIKDGIKDAVRDGIVEGVHIVRNGGRK